MKKINSCPCKCGDQPAFGHLWVKGLRATWPLPFAFLKDEPRLSTARREERWARVGTETPNNN